MAVTAAKSALPVPITNMKLPAGELFHRVSKFALYLYPKFCMDEWQDTGYVTVARVLGLLLRLATLLLALPTQRYTSVN